MKFTLIVSCLGLIFISTGGFADYTCITHRTDGKNVVSSAKSNPQEGCIVDDQKNSAK